MCIRKLIHLVLHLHPKAYDGDKKIPWNLFMEQCMRMMVATTQTGAGSEEWVSLFPYCHPILLSYLNSIETDWNIFSFWALFIKNICRAHVDFTLQSVLKLLSNFLNQVKQQQLPYNPSNPRMLRGARVAVEWGGNNNTSRQYVCTVDNFDGSKGLHHVTYDDGGELISVCRPILLPYLNEL